VKFLFSSTLSLSSLGPEYPSFTDISQSCPSTNYRRNCSNQGRMDAHDYWGRVNYAGHLAMAVSRASACDWENSTPDKFTFTNFEMPSQVTTVSSSKGMHALIGVMAQAGAGGNSAGVVAAAVAGTLRIAGLASSLMCCLCLSLCYSALVFDFVVLRSHFP